MDDASNDGLIASAAAVINPHLVPRYGKRLLGDGERPGRLIGHVGCTLVTAAGHHYSGVCIDTASILDRALDLRRARGHRRDGDRWQV